MKLPIRLENAIKKLYTAFHNGELDSFDCQHCAVGSICGNGSWSNARFTVKSIWDYNDSLAKKAIKHTGYNLSHLEVVEKMFVKLVPFELKFDKETQFKGLCAIVEYLCELDNIPNVMDYTKLFETENDKPKYQLSCS